MITSSTVPTIMKEIAYLDGSGFYPLPPFHPSTLPQKAICSTQKTFSQPSHPQLTFPNFSSSWKKLSPFPFQQFLQQNPLKSIQKNCARKSIPNYCFLVALQQDRSHCQVISNRCMMSNVSLIRKSYNYRLPANSLPVMIHNAVVYASATAGEHRQIPGAYQPSLRVNLDV